MSLQITQPRQKQRFSEGIGNVVNSYAQLSGQQAQQKAIAQQFPELAGMSPEMQKAAIPQLLKGRQGQQQLQQKQSYLDQIYGGQGQGQHQGMGDELSQVQQLQQGGQGQGQGFDPANTSDEQIARLTAYDSALGRDARHAKDVALRERSAKETRDLQREKFELQQLKSSPEYQRLQHLESSQAQADVKYNAALQETSKQHELKQQTLDRLEKLNLKGVTGKPYEKLLEKSGLVALTSDGRREFAADVKNLITDIRSILGGQFSNFEFQTILNAYPSADFSKGANEAIIKNLKSFQDIKSKEVEFAEQLKKDNKGQIPKDFQSQVNEMVRKYAANKVSDIKDNSKKIMNEEYGIPEGNVLMFDPQGEPLNVSPQDVERYESLGATFP
jgi:hypothetical protein